MGAYSAGVELVGLAYCDVGVWYAVYGGRRDEFGRERRVQISLVRFFVSIVAPSPDLTWEHLSLTISGLLQTSTQKDVFPLTLAKSP